MLRFGIAPFLECSSKGDKRFSAFSARLKLFDNRSIEECYQGFKIFDNGERGLTWREAKGKRPVNIEECRRYYSYLWDRYLYENPLLRIELFSYNGTSDIFGQAGHACQAEEIYRIKMSGLRPIPESFGNNM